MREDRHTRVFAHHSRLAVIPDDELDRLVDPITSNQSRILARSVLLMP